MSTKKRKRGSKGAKIVDKWTTKELYTIYSPEDLEIGNSKGKPIGETVASSPELVIGRIIEVPLSELTRNYSLMYIKLIFQITEVVGNNAKTAYKGHSYANDYIRSLVRRRRTRVDSIVNVETTDKVKLRVQTTAFTTSRIKASQKYSMRKIMIRIINDSAKELNFHDFVIAIIKGELNAKLHDECRKVHPIGQIEVQKSKVTSPLTTSE